MKPSPEAMLQEQWAMLDHYCVECHNDAELTADLSFEGRRLDDVHADPAVWEEVLRKLKIRAMPPREEPQPAAEMRGASSSTALEGTLDAAAAANPYAGATTVHRLNRAEYANADARHARRRGGSRRRCCRATAATSASTTSPRF